MRPDGSERTLVCVADHAPSPTRSAWLGGRELRDPGLVGEEAPEGVVLVVVEAAGGEFDFWVGDGWDPGGGVGELAVDGFPDGSGLGRIREVESFGLLHFAVDRWVAVAAPVAAAAAAEEWGM